MARYRLQTATFTLRRVDGIAFAYEYGVIFPDFKNQVAAPVIFMFYFHLSSLLVVDWTDFERHVDCSPAIPF